MNYSIDIYLYLAPLMLIVMVLEYLHRPDHYAADDTIINFRLMALTGLIKSITKFVELWCYLYFYVSFMEWRQGYLGFRVVSSNWAVCLIGFLLIDFKYYWFHRLGHEVRLLWANHIIHHSSEYFNFSTALRAACYTHFFKFIFFIPLPLLGFHPLFVLYTLAVVEIYQYFLHTQNRRSFGRLGLIFNTPQLHEVHHARNPEYLDKNYGAILIIWDRLLGTYRELDPQVPPVYGVTDPPKKKTLLEVTTHEFRQIGADLKKTTSFAEKCKVLFAGPAWSKRRFAGFEPTNPVSASIETRHRQADTDTVLHELPPSRPGPGSVTVKVQVDVLTEKQNTPGTIAGTI